VVLGAIALFAGMGIVGLAMVSIIGNVITLIALWVAVQRSLRLKLALAQLTNDKWQMTNGRRAILGESFPLMINHLLSTIYWKIDVLLLKALRDEASVGFYGAGYKYVDAFNIIPSLFTQSLFPVMSRLSGAEGNPLARTYVLACKLLLVLALPLSVGVSFLAGPLIQMLGGNAFLPHAAIALAIVIWHMPVGWINSVTNYALIATGQQRLLTRAFVGAVTFNIAANLIAIPLLGYVGAAIVTALSEVAQLATFYVYVRRFITRVNWLSLLGRPLLAAGIMATVAYAGLQMGLMLPALLLGGGLYLAAVLALRVFDAGERAILMPLLPSPLRRRLGLA
jgi:O-antigen/teichoic acid export membrane protein